MYFTDDGTVSITPKSPTTGYALEAITIEGFQNEIKIIDQAIDTFSTVVDVVNSADTIVGAISKLSGVVSTNYTVSHISSGSPSNTNLTPVQATVIIDGDVTGKTLILPTALAAGVIPGVAYDIIVVISGSATSNIIGVPSGEYLNDVQDGTLTLIGSTSKTIKAIAKSDGSRWYVTT